MKSPRHRAPLSHLALPAIGLALLAGAPSSPAEENSRPDRDEAPEVQRRQAPRDADRGRGENPDQTPPPGGEATPVWLGFMIGQPHPETASQLGLEPGFGISVNFIYPDSPAAEAGLAVHDILTELDGQRLVNPEQLQALVRANGQRPLPVVLLRNGKVFELEITPAPRPRDLPEPPAGRPPGDRWSTPDLAAPPLFRPSPQPAPRPDQERLPDGSWDSFGRELGQQAREQIEEAMRSLGFDLDFDTPLADQIQEQIERAMEGLESWIPQGQGDAPNVPDIQLRMSQSMTFSDGTHQIHLEGTEGARHLTVKDAEGKVIFDGPYNTEAERDQVPEEIRDKLETMLQSAGGRFRSRDSAPNAPRPSAPERPEREI